MPDPLQKPDADPLIGRTINDRFKITGLIARGGMGRVYRAQQQPLGREVALKVLDPRYEGDEDPEFQARFFLEASTAAKLTHPNTVTVFDYGKTHDEIYFIVMELVDGRTLAQILKQSGPMHPLQAIHIAVQIARSVREAHALGVIHRDLKPANVLVTQHADEESFVKVLDFGLVKDLKEEQELTQQGLFMGSPKSMSPEQIQGAPVDARTDIYSLSVMLYYMLTGKVPFVGTTQVQTLMAHIKEDVPPMVRADGISVSPDLQQVVLKGLRKEASERFESMNDFILALKQTATVLGHPMSASALITGPMPTAAEIDASGVRHAIMNSSPPPPLSGAPAQSSFPASPRRWTAMLAVVAIAAIGVASYALSRSEPGEQPPLRTAQATAAQATAAQATAQETVARCEVTFASTPPGAEVFVGERSYGRTPASVVWIGASAELNREITFRFELDGHRPMSVTRTILGDALDVQADLQVSEPTMRASMRPTMRASMMRRTMRTEMIGEGIDIHDPDYRNNPY